MLVVDNFIKDKSFLEELKNEVFWNNVGKLNWWNGWWNGKPRNICEEFIENVWTQFTSVENKIAGFGFKLLIKFIYSDSFFSLTFASLQSFCHSESSASKTKRSLIENAFLHEKR